MNGPDGFRDVGEYVMRCRQPAAEGLKKGTTIFEESKRNDGDEVMHQLNQVIQLRIIPEKGRDVSATKVWMIY